jgi:hypothetical protein
MRTTIGRTFLAAAVIAGAVASHALAEPQPQPRPHNLVIFVADGLRSRVVTPETAPALAALRAEGVDFQNSHSLYPTVTTPNASAIATGHALGDTGDFGNTLWVGKPLPPPFGTAVVPVEDDVSQKLLNERFGGNFIGRAGLLKAARAKGYATGVVGKLGPAAIQDLTARNDPDAIVIDDSTGSPAGEGLPLSPELAAAIKAAGLPAVAPDRGLNSWPGAYNMPGVQVANVDQQAWFVKVVTKVLLPRFKAQGKPFVLVFWSRDPDGTQHNQGDSLNSLTPGINGPTSMAAIRNASQNLADLRAALAEQGLAADTDIVVTADHGFATLARETKSAAAHHNYPDVKPGFIPPGFLSLDLGQALKLPVLDPAGFPIEARRGQHPRAGANLGPDPAKPQAVVTANGGSDLIYLPDPSGRALAPRIVEALTRLDYVGAIFVDDVLGPLAGALPMSAVGLTGDARTPRPAIVVSFRSFSTGCADPELCAAEIADSDLSQGEGIHGSFGRHDTHNFMAATGPDFRQGYVDPAPVSNADLAPTLAKVLGVELEGSPPTGRVAAEALRDGPAPAAAEPLNESSQPAANGFRTLLKGQIYDGRRYYDAAGMPGRTLGLDAP